MSAINLILWYFFRKLVLWFDLVSKSFRSFCFRSHQWEVRRMNLTGSYFIIRVVLENYSKYSKLNFHSFLSDLFIFIKIFTKISSLSWRRFIVKAEGNFSFVGFSVSLILSLGKKLQILSIPKTAFGLIKVKAQLTHIKLEFSVVC